MISLEVLLLFFLVALLTAFVNWLIPVLIYRKMFGLFKPRPKNFSGCNWWGVVMDVILAGLINIVVLNYILSADIIISIQSVGLAIILGFLAMGGLHVFMAVSAWKEWIMPKPWHWNAGGYWHMVSATVQFSYLAYPLVLLVNYPSLWKLNTTLGTTIILIFLTGLFIISLKLKNQDIKIGPLKISGAAW